MSYCVVFSPDTSIIRRWYLIIIHWAIVALFLCVTVLVLKVAKTWNKSFAYELIVYVTIEEQKFMRTQWIWKLYHYMVSPAYQCNTDNASYWMCFIMLCDMLHSILSLLHLNLAYHWTHFQQWWIQPFFFFLSACAVLSCAESCVVAIRALMNCRIAAALPEVVAVDRLPILM